MGGEGAIDVHELIVSYILHYPFFAIVAAGGTGDASILVLAMVLALIALEFTLDFREVAVAMHGSLAANADDPL